MNLLFLHLCVKSELEEQQCHKVVTIKSIEFDHLLLVSLQWFRYVYTSVGLDENTVGIGPYKESI